MEVIHIDYSIRNRFHRYAGECSNDSDDGDSYILIYFRRNWTLAKKRHPAYHQEKRFIHEMIDTINHEIVHAFCRGTDFEGIHWKVEEAMCQKFADEAVWCCH